MSTEEVPSGQDAVNTHDVAALHSEEAWLTFRTDMSSSSPFPLKSWGVASCCIYTYYSALLSFKALCHIRFIPVGSTEQNSWWLDHAAFHGVLRYIGSNVDHDDTLSSSDSSIVHTSRRSKDQQQDTSSLIRSRRGHTFVSTVGDRQPALS